MRPQADSERLAGHGWRVGVGTAATMVRASGNERTRATE